MDTHTTQSLSLTTQSASLMPYDSSSLSPVNEPPIINDKLTEVGVVVTQKEMSGREKSLANLKRYKKGQSGNPSGKPKGAVSLKTLVSKRLKNSQAVKIV